MVLPESKKQSDLIKAVLSEMRVKFKATKSEVKIHSPALNKKIKEARREKANGELITIDPKKIWESI